MPFNGTALRELPVSESCFSQDSVSTGSILLVLYRRATSSLGSIKELPELFVDDARLLLLAYGKITVTSEDDMRIVDNISESLQCLHLSFALAESTFTGVRWTW